MYSYLALPHTLHGAVQSRGRNRVVAAIGFCILFSACAAKVLPTPIVVSPRYPEFTFPVYVLYKQADKQRYSVQIDALFESSKIESPWLP